MIKLYARALYCVAKIHNRGLCVSRYVKKKLKEDRKDRCKHWVRWSAGLDGEAPLHVFKGLASGR